MKLVSNLIEGCVPAGQQCFAEFECELASNCPVSGNTVHIPFSCAVARGFEITHTTDEKNSAENT